MNKIKWGILGCGNIAKRFAGAFDAVDQGVLVAGASRSLEKAQEFCNTHNIPTAYGSYEELLANPEIDAIYVATPHSLHPDHVLMSFDRGKAVLCEKPLTVNAHQTTELQLAAEKKGLFLMEAMWTRFLPTIRQAQKWVSTGVLGQIRSIQVDFSFKSNKSLESRVFNPELAGGALLDVGIYPITMASIITNEYPKEIHSSAVLGQGNVDYQSAYLLKYENGTIAQLSAALTFNGSKEAVITGDNGYIRIPLFWQSESIELHLIDKEPEIHSLPFDKNGFEYEIREACDCIQKGQLQSKIHPVSQTLEIMEIMDKIREDVGIKYPFE